MMKDMRVPNTYPVLEMIIDERVKQVEKWSDQSNNHPFEWVSILGEEYGELCQAVNESFLTKAVHKDRDGKDKMIKEAVHIAAVAVAFIESLEAQS